MMDQHRPERAPGIARALAVLMLLAGIVAMHSAVFGTAHASTGGHPPTAHAPVAALAPPEHTDPPPFAAPTDDHAATLTGRSHHSATDTPALAAIPPAHAAIPTDSTLPIAAQSDPRTGCGAGGCAQHTAVHACVFVLAALAVALTLVMLYRLGDTAEAARRTPRIWRGRRTRPPPWTVLTLSQLAILRI
ncbi:hypothetical protein [Nocardia sp. NPDC058633]|uniref:hypothetical protein n=1 Tax=Nocardia sp. NPDC058633 TaxID=3346568 RepID=UPI0036680F6A